MKIEFVKKQGTLSEALGVDQELMADLDSFVNNMVMHNASTIEIIEAVQDAFDLDENETAVFFYGLGYYLAKLGF